MSLLQLSAIRAEWPMATPSAPSASAFATSAPLRMPPAEADFATLANEELAGIRQAQMVRVEAIARLDALIEPLRGIAPFVGNHAALTRACRRAGHGGAPGQRDLGLEAQCPEAHPGDVD